MKTHVCSILTVAALLLLAASFGCKKEPQPTSTDKQPTNTQGIGDMVDKAKEGAEQMAENVKEKTEEMKEKAEEAKDAAAAQIEELRKKALEQKESFLAAGKKIAQYQEDIKNLSITEKAGAKGTELMEKMTALLSEQTTIKNAFDALVKQIKDAGGDVSDLALK
ncbi:MAG: hypothetical protein JW709_09060 [Sedimentisphaerales bacterium]|nr:hypothetical protein [Sedimentisphaerales bacterium]